MSRLILGQGLVARLLSDFGDERILAFHVALTGQHEQSHAGRLGDRQFVLEAAIGRCQRLPDVAEICGCERFAHLKLTLSAEVIVRLSAPHDLERQMRRRHPTQQRIGLQHLLLLLTQDAEVAAVIHAPDPLLADLGDVPLQFRSLQVCSQPRDELRQSVGILLVEIAVEHVVLALMPHDRFEPIANTALVQLGERLANELERSRVELLPLVRRIGIPIKSDRRPSDRRLDDGDRKICLLFDSSSKRHFRPERTQRLERNPTFGRFIAIAQDVRVEDVALRLAGAFEVRVVVDAIRMRVRSHHVGLTSEEEHSRDLLGEGGTIRQEGQHHQRQGWHDHFSKRRVHGVSHSMVERGESENNIKARSRTRSRAAAN